MINKNAYTLGTKRSCIRELFEYGRARAAVVGADKVYDYSLGNPSIPAPAEVNETVAALLQDTDPLALHGYTSAIGDLATRQAIADDLNTRYSAGAKPGDFFITCGAAPGLCAVFGALSVPGAEILAIAPFFPEYRPFAESAGFTFRMVEADIPNFQVNLQALEEAITENTQAVIINSPNNPSGTVYSRETLTALGAILEEKSRKFGHPIYIISDEPYRELCYDGTEAPFIPGIYKNTIICYSYSKSLSLPGELIGYVYVPENADDAPALLAAVAGSARRMGHVCAPSLWQKVIARCTHLRPDLISYDKNRRTLYDGLVAAGYKVAKPAGAFYLFVEAPGGDANAFSEKAKAKDLLVVPGDDFGCPGYFRLCYCVSYRQIIESLPIFAELIK